MGEPAFRNEAIWLRTFLEQTGGDVAFDNDALDQMSEGKISYPEVLEQLLLGRIVHTEKSDFGWRWTIEGENCDGECLVVVLEVEANLPRAEVVEVYRQ